MKPSVNSGRLRQDVDNDRSIWRFLHKRADKEVDFQALREHGLGFVRRSTGGRAVLHDQELTYSIVVSERYPDMPANVADAYAQLSRGLLIGLRKLGLDAAMTGQEDVPKERGGSERVTNHLRLELTRTRRKIG